MLSSRGRRRPLITRRGRLTARLVGCLAVLIALLGFAAPTASAAGTDCNPKVSDPQHNAYFQVCVVVSNGNASGYVRWYFSDGYFVPATVYVRQCRVDLNPAYCGTFASNRGSGTNIVSTKPKAAAYGHVYQACTSFDVFLEGRHYSSWATNYCSGWKSYP